MTTTQLPVDPVVVPQGRPRPGLRSRRRRHQAVFRWIVVTLTAIFFLVPLISMVDFTTRLLSGKRSGIAWQKVLDLGRLAPDARSVLLDGLQASLWLAVLTAALTLLLLVPTMTWIRIKAPRLNRLVEFVCLLPLVIPAIVLVVGYYPIYRFIGRTFSTSAVWLCLAYVILVLPFAYRALESGLSAIDVRTLSEAARTLGASFPTIVWRIVLPNLRSAVAGAAFLTVALVLGEFTVASLLSKNNLQVALVAVNSADPRFATAIALLVLLLAFLLMFLLTFLADGRRRRGAAS